MDNYGQSQSACGQPWQAIKTPFNYLVIPILASLTNQKAPFFQTGCPYTILFMLFNF